MRFIFLLVASFLFSQPGSAQAPEGIDPEAQKILDKLRTEYESYQSVEISFDLVIDLPDQEAEKQKGRVIQQGDMYKLDLDDQSIYCNGAYVWVHLKDNHEVQINDVELDDEEAGFLTPRDMMQIYESEDYLYAVVGKQKGKNGTVVTIEFKPTDPDSEYAKLRIAVNEKKNQMETMEVFSKDGSRYALNFEDLLTNKKYDPSIFVFDEKKFPGIHVEDLRL